MLLGQFGNYLTQALYFILLARLLGVREYGIFAAAFALVSIVTPYSTLGANMLFMRYVTADHTVARRYWGNAIAISGLASLVLAGLMVATGPFLTHVRTPLVFVLLVLANCFFMQLTLCAGSVFTTFENMKISAMLGAIANMLRLATVAVMRLTLHRATVTQWCVGVLVSSALAAIIAFIFVRREIGPAIVDMRLLWRRLREGFGFAFAGTTQSVYNDVDKAMLGHYGLSMQDGFYTLAYRVVDFGTAPIAALDSAVLPRYFRLGHQSFKGVVKLALKSASVAFLAGLGVSMCILITAPIVPHLVGHSFAGVVTALHWLCWLPPIRAIHRMIGGILTSTGNQNVRTAAQFTAGAFNFLLNLWWIPVYGWIGAAWSSVATDGLLAILNVSLVAWLHWRPRPKPSSSPAN